MEFAYPPGATPLDPDEAAELVPRHINTQGQLNEWEQVNIIHADEWAFARRRDIVNERFIRMLHGRMFGETWSWAGEYRHSDKNIGVPWYTIAEQVKDVCDTVQYWLSANPFPLDEIAIRLHHRLVYVHPFPNGNGRHTRLMADLLLWNNGRDRFTWGGNDLQQQNDARSRYISALKEADDQNIEPLLAFARS